MSAHSQSRKMLAIIADAIRARPFRKSAGEAKSIASEKYMCQLSNPFAPS